MGDVPDVAGGDPSGGLGDPDAEPPEESGGDAGARFMVDIVPANDSVWAAFFAPGFEVLDFFDDPRRYRVIPPSLTSFTFLCRDE